jgi:hypothetical protein
MELLPELARQQAIRFMSTRNKFITALAALLISASVQAAAPIGTEGISGGTAVEGISKAVAASGSCVLWTPANLPAGTSWWDTTDSSTIGLSGSSVTSWTDRLNSIEVVQFTGGNEPIYSATGMNGHPGFAYNGTTQFLETADTFLQSGTWSIFAVTDPSSLAAAPVVDADSFTTNRIAQYLRYNSSALQSISFNTAVTAFTANGPTPTVNVPAIIYAIQNGGFLTVFQNDIAGTPTSTTGTPESAVQNMTFGASLGNTGRAFYSGEQGDIVLGETPFTTDQEQKLAGYEAWKFGTQASLNPSSPYITRPPCTSDP